MTDPAPNQWEFPNLLDSAPKRKIWAVSELNRDIRNLMDSHYGRISVSGEVTNLRRQSSGHYYFSLKDAASQISCVLFRGESVGDRSLIEDGRHLIVEGDLTVYEPRGQYQLILRKIEVQGIGALQQAFERLKQKLHAEGLFDPARKQPLPPRPRRIGLITSPTGAAIRDVLHVIQRRFAGLEIVLVPCRVQGREAGPEIVSALRLLNQWNNSLPGRQTPLDLILVTRGGGSLEDLWAFNEEPVARAIAASRLPVVTGIGHEIDFTIADFTADFRAATPSAAAEIVTQGMFECRQVVGEFAQRMQRAQMRYLQFRRESLLQFSQRLARNHPKRRLEQSLQRLDELDVHLRRRTGTQLQSRQQQWRQLAQRLRRVRPVAVLAKGRERLERFRRDLDQRLQSHLEQLNRHLRTSEERLRLLSPDHVLQRGYSITFDAATGNVLRCASSTQPGQQLLTRLAKGNITSSITSAQSENSDP